MSSFEVTAPDGKLYAVDAPEGATQEQALEHFKANWKPAPMSVTETLAAMKKGGPHAKMKEIAAGLTTGSVGALADTASNLTQDTNLSDLVTGQKPSKFAQRYADRGIDTKSGLFKASELGGNVLLSSGVAGGLAKIAEVAGASAPWVQALASSGAKMGGFGKGERPASLVRGVVGGGLTGGVSTAITNPNLKDVGIGTAVGAFAPHVLGILGTGATKGYDLLKGKMGDVWAGKIARQVAGPNLDATIEALRNAPENLTAAQAAYGKASPEFASLGGLGRDTHGVPYLAKEIADQAENRNIMGAMTPNKEQALANEAQVIANRTGALEQGVAAKEQALADQVRRFEEGTTKNLLQTPHGEAIAGQADVLKTAASDAVKPLYAEAFALAPHKFDVGNIPSVAGEIKDRLPSLLDSGTDPKLTTAISKIFQSTPATPGREVTNLATGNKYMQGATPAIPPQASLEDLDQLSKALNSAISGAKSAAQPDTILLGNLGRLKTEVNRTITSNISKEALAAYDKAKTIWLKTVHEPFGEGEVRKIMKENQASGRPMTLPENAPKAFLSSESGAADFNRAFGDNPEAVAALNSGIEHQILNAPNPEKFIVDNRNQLSIITKNNPELGIRLENLVNNLRSHTAGQEILTAERKAIPELVAAEVAAAPSAANQERVISHLRNILHPFPGQENASPFLSALEKADVSSLNAPQQLAGLNTLQAKFLRDADLARQAEAGKGAVERAWKDNTFLQRLPSYLNSTTSTLNKALGIIEGKVLQNTDIKLSKGMESPKNALEMLNFMPADQRDTIIRALRQSGPTVSRAAVLSSTQNKD